MREWLVGGGIVTSDAGLLLVQNRRRDGREDWTPPGGVIDPGEDVLTGLTREVEEETGLRIAEWEGPAYRIEAEAPEMGWRLTVEVHRAVSYEGSLHVDDPDGIVVAARFVAVDECTSLLAAAPQWVREPVGDWLSAPSPEARSYAYRVDGAMGTRLSVLRLDPDGSGR